MSETLTFRIYTEGGPRAAAAIGRRRAYLAGWIGLHIAANLEVPLTGANNRVRCFNVTIVAAEQRVSDQHEASFVYRRVHRQWPAGTAVRTLVEGVDYSDRNRHAVPAGSVGAIVGRVFPNFRVAFAEVPGRTFRYAPQDLEALP